MRRATAALTLALCLAACARHASPPQRARTVEPPRTASLAPLSPFERTTLETFVSDAELIRYFDTVTFVQPQLMEDPTRTDWPRPPEPPPQRMRPIRALSPELLAIWRDSGAFLTHGPIGDDAGARVVRSGGLVFVLSAEHVRSFDLEPSTMTLRLRSELHLSPPAEVLFDYLFAADGELVVLGNRRDEWAVEVVRIEVSPNGELRPRSAHRILWLPPDGFGYRARLVGRELFVYLPHRPVFQERMGADAPLVWMLPALADGGPSSSPRVLLHGADVLHPVAHAGETLLHTLVRCDLASTDLRCDARAIAGPGAHTLLADDALYVWMVGWRGEAEPPSGSFLVRMPFDASATGALRMPATAAGLGPTPLRAHAGHLHALLADDARPGLHLIDAPIELFTSVPTPLDARAYSDVPSPTTAEAKLDPELARLVGSFLVWGEEGSAGYYMRYGPKQPEVAVRALEPAAYAALPLGHTIGTARALGERVALVGTDGWHLHLSLVGTEAGVPAVAARYTMRDAVPKLDSYGGVFPLLTGDTADWLGLFIAPTPAASDAQGVTLLPLRWAHGSQTLDPAPTWFVPLAADAHRPPGVDALQLDPHHGLFRVLNQLLLYRADGDITLTQRIDLGAVPR